MPVYDIAAGQQHAKPVSGFYQGKAMRLALENKKLSNKAMEQEIGAFDAREDRAERQVAVNERMADVSETNAEANLAKVTTAYSEHIRKATEAEQEEARTESARALSLYEDSGEEAALEFLKQSSDSEEEYQQFISMAEQVGGVRPLLNAMSQTASEIVDGVKAESGEEKTAGIQNAEKILEVMRDEDMTETEKMAMVKSLGGHVDDKGGINIDFEVAEEIASEIMDSEDIGESGIFESNDAVAEKLLAAEFVRLFKKGGMDISEVKEAAVASVTKLLSDGGKTSSYTDEQLEAEIANPASRLYGKTLEEAREEVGG